MTSDSPATSRLPTHDDPAATRDLLLGPDAPTDTPTDALTDTSTGSPSSAPSGASTRASTEESFGAYGAPSGDTATRAPYVTPPPYSYASMPAASAAPTDRRRRRQHWAGAILIVLGVLILGNNLGLLWWVEPEFILPLMFVGAGAWLLFGRGRRG
jgi:hypothetical protein